ncbi:hypothetical protein ACGFJ5_30845 [Micromonospora echinaurantiaca]|uniref:hypothetical protein n=1 Tax=Micromonospora echinaurantiaca TaxID=47857 RepID=UPI0037109ABB
MPADRPWVTVVRDPHDTPATRDLLARVDRPDRGALVVRPVPGTTSPAMLALAVLAALGKQVEPQPRAAQRQWWPLAQAWTVGHQIDHLVVDRAHTLPAHLITHLISLAAASGAHLWFIDASPAHDAPALAGLAHAVRQRPQQLLTITLAEPAAAPQPATAAPHIPPVILPHTGFLTFRYACQRRLPAAQAALVDDAWRHTFDTIRGWLNRTEVFAATHRPDPQRVIAATRTLTAGLSVQLADLLYTAAHPADALLRLRAAQASLFRLGLLLHHEPRTAAPFGGDLGCRLTPEVAVALNRAVSTSAAAAAVLQLVNPLDGSFIPARPQSDALSTIEPDGSQLHTDYGNVPLPVCAHAILRAHRHFVDPTGTAPPDTALFTGQWRDADNLTERTLRRLRLAALPTPWYRRSRAYLRGHATPWMRHRGLDLCVLAELAPRPGHL